MWWGALFTVKLIDFEKKTKKMNLDDIVSCDWSESKRANTF